MTYRAATLLLVLSFLLNACGMLPSASPQQATQAPSAETSAPADQAAPIDQAASVDQAERPPTETPFQPAPPTPTATLPPTPAPAAWLAPYLPGALVQALALPEGLAFSAARESARLRLELAAQPPAGDAAAEDFATWTYALAAPFATILEGVSSDALLQRWQGQTGTELGKPPLILEQGTLAALSAKWGEPADGAAEVWPPEQLIEIANQQPGRFALLPFEALEPRWKVLQVDGISPLWKEFDPQAYPLTLHFTLTGDPDLVAAVRAVTAQTTPLPLLNRDPGKLTTVVLTGVTALVRATAETMRRRGITYPAKDVGPILRQADIAHVSNEIPFTKDCPTPDPNQVGLRFCSDPAYIELLQEIGTDVVELTGDHFGDWGPAAMNYTLDLYDEQGWVYYGGGRNREDARQARLLEHNGNKIAFIGCNAKGGGYATANKTNPGAVSCDFDWMHAEITRLSAEGYNVITTFQHFEYYTYKAQPNQVKDSRGMAEAGAAIVSGSQAHQPQALEFYQGAFIHYGLGNLFFDQYFMGVPTSQGFLDRHVFYNGRYISTELIGIYFVDFARPRLMTPAERKALLTSVFTASGWNP